MKKLNLNAIRIDGGTQSRVSLNEATVAEYAELIADGVMLPEVVVFFDGSDHWLADGFHRLHAYRKAGKASIPADVRDGMRRDAVLFSAGANGDHGLRRTNEDKRRSVEMLLDDDDAREWSDQKIAKHCAVGVPFVGAVRRPAVAAKQKEGRAKSALKAAQICNPITPDQAPMPERTPAQINASVARMEADRNNEIRQQTEELQAEVEPEYTPLDAANDQIIELQNDLASAILGGASEEDKANAQALIADLRARIKALEATLKAVTLSRDTYMNENAELRRQITRQRKEIDKVTGRKTA